MVAAKPPLRLMVFDRTCHDEARFVGLSTAWSAGARLYRALGRLDGAFGITSWAEAFDALLGVDPTRPIAEIQYWGHGRWGRAMVDRDVFDAAALREGHPLHARLAALRERLLPEAGSLFWFRTCETFGARRGHDFASRLADHLGARVAGHTFVIGATQSGLHGLHPGRTPDWSAAEGLAEGTPEDPRRAAWSGARQPNTISFLHGAVPPEWFSSTRAEPATDRASTAQVGGDPSQPPKP